jgi:hypothetical protein
MHEHGCEEGQKIGQGVGKEAARDESPFLNKSVTPGQLYDKKQDVHSNQAIRDYWNGSASGIIITNRYQKVLLLFKFGEG